MSVIESRYKYPKHGRFLFSHIVYVQGFLSLLLALDIGLYVNIITIKLSSIPSHSFLDAFWEIRSWNALILLALLIIIIQSTLLSAPQKTFREIGSRLIEDVLAAACASLKYHNKDINLRAIVTIIDKSGRTRTTKYSYNVRPDPERTATFPVGFGVTGEAIINRKVIAQELPPNHMETYHKEIRKLILPELKTVLAAPIYLPDKRESGPIGVLAFDSTDDFSKTLFESRNAKDIAQAWADIIGDILKVIY
jgi:hypothetical protein